MTGSKGFTLVEALVALGIFASLTVIGFTIFKQVLDVQKETVRAQDTAQDFRFVAELLARDLKRSVPDLAASGENVLVLHENKASGPEVRYYVGTTDDGIPAAANACATVDCKLFRGNAQQGYKILAEVPIDQLQVTGMQGSGMRSLITVVLEPRDGAAIQTSVASRTIEEVAGGAN